MGVSVNIGNWIRRSGQKWHLAESVVAGDVVTRCGRRMRDSLPFYVSEVMPLTRMIGQPQLCKAGCDKDEVATITEADNIAAIMDFEDDGSTHNETAP